MAKIHDPATQTALDIEQARRRAKLNVIATREYFYGTFCFEIASCMLKILRIHDR